MSCLRLSHLRYDSLSNDLNLASCRTLARMKSSFGCLFEHAISDLPRAPFDRIRFVKKKGLSLRFMILGSDVWKNLRGTPLTINDFGIRFLEKTLGGHPLRFVILGSDF